MAQTSSIYVYDHFDLYLTPVTLTFNLPEKNFHPQRQQLCQIVLKAMHYCTSYGPDKSGWTHRHTHIHRTKIITTMSCLPASGLDKHYEIIFCDGIYDYTSKGDNSDNHNIYLPQLTLNDTAIIDHTDTTFSSSELIR